LVQIARCFQHRPAPRIGGVISADGHTERSAQTVAHARVVTLVWLSTTVFSSILMPSVGVLRETNPLVAVGGVVGVVAVVATQCGVLFGAVTPAWSTAQRTRWRIAFGVASVASLVLVAPVATGRWPTWAWIGAAIVGTVPILVSPLRSVGVGTLCVVAGLAVASSHGGSLAQALIIIVIVGAGIAVVNWFPIWVWGLLAAAQAGREATATLARSEERLRFARDLHDLLGHRLTVIALKAELIERLSTIDPNTVAAEAETVRSLAGSALIEVREAASGYRQVDLSMELRALQTVVEASGVRCSVATDSVPAAAAAVFAPVAREAVTNMLRHSRARACSISVTADESKVELVVMNDGAAADMDERASVPSQLGGSGLSGMTERVRTAGGSFEWSVSCGNFVVTASLPTVVAG
jgi:two-component system sensor histidine kinase DesK